MYLLTNLSNYLAIVVSAAGATAVSALTVVSTATAVESVVAGAVEAPPQATNDVAIATIAITFFILFVLLFKFKYTLIGITYYTKYRVIEFLI
jgi:hypothetical protein